MFILQFVVYKSLAPRSHEVATVKQGWIQKKLKYVQRNNMHVNQSITEKGYYSMRNLSQDFKGS